MPRTQEQLRAEAAWNAVSSVQEAMLEKYSTFVQGLPASVLTSGLGQYIAFVLAKDDRAHKEAVNHLARWVLQRDRASGRDLLHDLIEHDSEHYRRQTEEAMAYLAWLKRFSQARSKNNL